MYCTEAVWELLFLTHERTIGVEDLRTVGGIFIHDTTVAELLNERFFPLDIGIRDIADFIRMETVPVIKIMKNLGVTILCPREFEQKG